MSTHLFGCFFCLGKCEDADGNCDRCGKPLNVSVSLLKINIGRYQVTEILGRGFFGWTVVGEDAYQNFAIKIIPEHRLARKTIPDDEARNLAISQCAPHIVTLLDF